MSERAMINPHLLEATYLKLERPGPRFAQGAKLYRPAFGSHGAYKGCRHAFRTATRARQHAVEVLERWCRLYDEAVLQIAEGVATEMAAEVKR